MIDQRVLLLHFLSDRSIERDQPAVKGGDEHLAFVGGNTTIDDVASHSSPYSFRHG